MSHYLKKSRPQTGKLGYRMRIAATVAIIKYFFHRLIFYNLSVKQNTELPEKVDFQMCTRDETHYLYFFLTEKGHCVIISEGHLYICFCHQDLGCEQNTQSHFPSGCDILDQP